MSQLFSVINGARNIGTDPLTGQPAVNPQGNLNDPRNGPPGMVWNAALQRWDRGQPGTALGGVTNVGWGGGGGGGGHMSGGGGGGGGWSQPLGNPGGTMASPSPVAGAGKGFGSLRAFTDMQLKVSPWEQMQKGKLEEQRALKDAASARRAFYADNPALGPSFAQPSAVQSRPSTDFEQAALDGLAPTARPVVQPWTPPAGFSGTAPFERSLRPNHYGTGGSNVPLKGFADGTLNSGPSDQWAVVGERGPEVMRVPAGSQIIPNEVLQGQAAQPAPAPGGWWAAPLPMGGGQAAPQPNAGADPLQEWRDATSPEAMKIQRERFMRTPQGRMWLAKAEMDQQAAGAAAAWEQEKFNAQEAGKNKRAADAVNAANQRAAASIQATDARAKAALKAAAERQQAGFDNAKTAKDDAEAMAYHDAVSKVKARWEAGLITPEDMIRFDGLRTSKAVEAELEHIDKDKAANRPATFTEVPDPKKTYVVGSGANPKVITPQPDHSNVRWFMPPGAQQPVAFRVVTDENGRQFMEPIPDRKGDVPGATAPAGGKGDLDAAKAAVQGLLKK